MKYSDVLFLNNKKREQKLLSTLTWLFTFQILIIQFVVYMSFCEILNVFFFNKKIPEWIRLNSHMAITTITDETQHPCSCRKSRNSPLSKFLSSSLDLIYFYERYYLSPVSATYSPFSSTYYKLIIVLSDITLIPLHNKLHGSYMLSELFV